MQNELTIQVRYSECDPMGVVHHSVYPIWFEMGRTELLRETNISYKEFEDKGVMLVVAELHVKYHSPAKYDDSLTLFTRIKSVTRAIITHEYVVRKDDKVLTSATTMIACVNEAGVLQKIPDDLVQGSRH